jgi:O-antigen ligase
MGTIQYERIIEERFAYVPEFLQNGIHGEFLRVLTENGLVGLLAYLGVWGLALVRVRAVLGAAVRRGHLSTAQSALLQLATFVPCLVYVGFEASGTHSLIVLLFVSIYADMLGAWLAPAPLVSPLPVRRPGPRPARWPDPFTATIHTGGTP